MGATLTGTSGQCLLIHRSVGRALDLGSKGYKFETPPDVLEQDRWNTSLKFIEQGIQVKVQLEIYMKRNLEKVGEKQEFLLCLVCVQSCSSS